MLLACLNIMTNGTPSEWARCVTHKTEVENNSWNPSIKSKKLTLYTPNSDAG
jgi:hypothetical protein